MCYDPDPEWCIKKFVRFCQNGYAYKDLRFDVFYKEFCDYGLDRFFYDYPLEEIFKKAIRSEAQTFHMSWCSRDEFFGQSAFNWAIKKYVNPDTLSYKINGKMNIGLDELAFHCLKITRKLINEGGVSTRVPYNYSKKIWDDDYAGDKVLNPQKITLLNKALCDAGLLVVNRAVKKSNEYMLGQNNPYKLVEDQPFNFDEDELY